ncbi:MAG TPA: SusC/RagA family TonB-linked outer membrane protein [Gemmatimonadaceae bacterium]|nr:SusC/RagA family TonB-linked outer membrane protein [Gemmatimonadaceae bacterium]
MKHAALLTAVCLCTITAARTNAQQQRTTITGHVTSEAGAPLASASVFIDGLGAGAMTQPDGHYSFTVAADRANGQNVTIHARLIGYKEQSASIALTPGTITHDFTLVANPLQLGEVVVTGAGTSTTREKLGNVINTVSADVIEKSNEPNVVNALSAKAPNVYVVSQSGEPGASSYIRIRGIKSLSGNGQPLFVVDGVPIDNSTIPGEGGNLYGATSPNRASDIAPQDIESVEILKGAAAAAIYGARASDGVVLITTKSGQAGQTRYSLRSSYSFDDVNKEVPLQREYGQGSNGNPGSCSTLDCSASSLSWGPKLDGGTPTYDHWGELFHTGHSFDNNLSISGGNDRTTVYLSLGRLHQTGTIIGPNNWYTRNSARLKASYQLFHNLKIGGNVSFTDDRGAFAQRGGNISGLLLGGLRTSPDFDQFPYLDPDSHLQRSYRFPHPSVTSLTRSRGYDNPLFSVYELPSTEETDRTIASLDVTYDPLDWLTFKYTLGGDYIGDNRLTGIPFTASVAPLGRVLRGQINRLQIDHNLVATLSHTFSSSFSGTLTLGQNLNMRRSRNASASGNNLIAPQPFSLNNTVTQTSGEFNSTIHTESYFGQATADLFDQLYLTVALRNDGFSTFGESNPRAWYPKASAAWTFTNALGNGDHTGLLSYGKFRIAYGETGKEPDVYSTVTTLSSGSFGTGWGDFLNSALAGYGGLFTSGTLGNNNLKPERQKEIETGVDLGLFNQIADLGITFYNNNSSDVILSVPRAPTSGYTSQLLNGARIRNRGWEATFNARPITNDKLTWEVGLQWAKNELRVLDLDGADFINAGGGTFSDAVPAATVGGTFAFRGYGFVRCGVSSGDNLLDNNGGTIDLAAACAGQPNGALFIDASGFPVKDPVNRVVGNPNPDWTGSIHTDLRFGRWELSALVDRKQGGQVANMTRGALTYFGTHADTRERDVQRTFGRDILAGAVAGPGAGTAVMIGQGWYTGLGASYSGIVEPFLEDGSYTKLREVAVSYTFDRPWVQSVGFASIDLRVAGRNLHTWTDYSGVDPETNLVGAASLVQGYDFFNTPQTRSIVVSVGLNR